MIERLIEYWLDNAHERSYQAPFCQMLAAQGHRILHSTRHGPMEMGKDLITLDGDGVPCAFQLKANPGSRLTQAALTGIWGQILQLTTTRIHLSGGTLGRHRAFLVTNGEVDEEATRQVSDYNSQLHSTTEHAAISLEIISRGTMLAFARDLGPALWPSEVAEMRDLLALLTGDGKSLLKKDLLHNLLRQVLRLAIDDTVVAGPKELDRRSSSAALLTAIALTPSTKAENHYAVLEAWTMCAAYIAASAERAALPLAGSSKAVFDTAVEAAFDRIGDMAAEIEARGSTHEGSPLTEGFAWKPRNTILAGLLSAWWFYRRERGWPSDEARCKIEAAIKALDRKFDLWGESAVPFFLSYTWHLRSTDVSPAPDRALALLTVGVQRRALSKHGEGLANPYYDWEAVLHHRVANSALADETWKRDDPLAEEDTRHGSFTAEGLFHLLARTGLKQHCKFLWADHTRLWHQTFEPEAPWMGGLWRTERGRGHATQPPSRQDWNELAKRAAQVSPGRIPAGLVSDRNAALLFSMVFPQRLTSAFIRFLGWKFNECWFLSRGPDLGTMGTGGTPSMGNNESS